MSIFNLEAILSLNSKQYEDGLNDAEGKANSFGTKLASGLGTAAKVGAAAVGAVKAGVTAASAGFVKAAGNAAAYGDSIDKSSQRLGISAEAYQEWDAVLQHSGTSIDAMGGSFRKLANASQKASKDQVAAFQKLGLSMDEVASMSAEELFGKVITGLQNMEEGTERTAVATRLLGGGATRLGALLNTSAEDTQAMRDRVHELGGVMSNEAVKGAAAYQDALQDMQTAFSGIGRNLISNFLPSMAAVMNGVADLFGGNKKDGLGKISDGIDGIVTKISEKLPDIVDSAASIVESFVEAIVKNLPKIIKSGTKIILKLSEGIIKNLPAILKAGIQAIITIAQGIAEALPKLIPAAIDAILTIVDALIDNIPLLVDAALQLMVGLAKGLIKALPRIIQKIPEIIEGIVDALLDSIDLIIDAGVELFVALVENLPAIIDGIVKALPKIILAILEGLAELGTKLAELFTKAWEGIKEIFAPVGDFFGGVWNAITGAFATVGEWFSNTFGGAWEGIKNIFSGIGDWFQERWNDIVNVFIGVGAWFANIFVSAYNGVTKAFSSVGDFFASVWNTIKGIFSGVWDHFVKIGGQIIDGLKAGVTGAWNGFVDFFANLMGGIQGIAIKQLKIGSPSKVFADIGKFIDLGLAEGIGDNIFAVNDAVNDLVDATMDDGFYQDREITTTTSVENHVDDSDNTVAVPRYAAPQYLNLTVELGGQKVQSVIYQMVQDEAGRVGMQIVRGNA